MIVFLAYLAFTWNWRRLRRAQLRYAVVVSLMALRVVAVPWHHAMLIRHGTAFWNELFGDNHWRRMVLGRHGDRGTFEYFLRELGYGVLAVGGVRARGARPGRSCAARTAAGDPAELRKQGIIWLGAIWFVSGYAVVSLSMTKFHHYVLPAIPGLAIVVGVLHRRSVRAAAPGARRPRRARRDSAAAAGGGRLHRRQERRPALPVAVLVRLHPQQERPPLARRARLLGAADCVRGRVRAGHGRVRRAAHPALGRGSARRRGHRVHVLPARRVHARVAPFWSQKGPIATYYQLRRSPEERLVAFMLYWRGETFYTSNEIYEGPTEERTVFDEDGAEDKLKDWIARHRGRRTFFLFERFQQSRLQGLLPPEARGTFHVVDAQNNKFSLRRSRALMRWGGRTSRTRSRRAASASSRRAGPSPRSRRTGALLGGHPREAATSSPGSCSPTSTAWPALAADRGSGGRSRPTCIARERPRGDGRGGRLRRSPAAAPAGAPHRDAAPGRARARLGDDRRGGPRAVGVRRRMPRGRGGRSATPSCAAERGEPSRGGRGARRASW